MWKKSQMHHAKLAEELCLGEKRRVKNKNKSLVLKINSLGWFTLNSLIWADNSLVRDYEEI